MSRACGGYCAACGPDDYVLATGEVRSVREFVEQAFAQIGTKIVWRGQDAD